MAAKASGQSATVPICPISLNGLFSLLENEVSHCPRIASSRASSRTSKPPPNMSSLPPFSGEQNAAKIRTLLQWLGQKITQNIWIFKIIHIKVISLCTFYSDHLYFLQDWWYSLCSNASYWHASRKDSWDSEEASDHFVQVTFSCTLPGPTNAPEKFNFYRSCGDPEAGSAAVMAQRSRWRMVPD